MPAPWLKVLPLSHEARPSEHMISFEVLKMFRQVSKILAFHNNNWKGSPLLGYRTDMIGSLKMHQAEVTDQNKV